MSRQQSVLLATAASVAVACASGPEPSGKHDRTLAEAIVGAHGTGFDDLPGVSALLHVELEGRTVLEARMLLEPATGRSRLELPDGTVAIFDGKRAWVMPEDSTFRGARFHLLAWPFFLSAPWRLDDRGVRLEGLGVREIAGRPLRAARLSFSSGAAENPHDWYVAHAGQITNRLMALAYPAAYGQPVEEGTGEAHIAIYTDVLSVERFLVPQVLYIHEWSEERGVESPPIGRITFAEMRFDPVPDRAFSLPVGRREETAVQ